VTRDGNPDWGIDPEREEKEPKMNDSQDSRETGRLVQVGETVVRQVEEIPLTLRELAAVKSEADVEKLDERGEFARSVASFLLTKLPLRPHINWELTAKSLLLELLLARDAVERLSAHTDWKPSAEEVAERHRQYDAARAVLQFPDGPEVRKCDA
jgi:hypothetical protein